MVAFHLSAVVAGVLGVVAFGMVRQRLSHRAPMVRGILFCVLALLSIPSLLAVLHYAHVLPEMEWFYTMRSWNGSELWVVFAGAAGGAMATLLPRSWLMLPLFLTIAVAVIPYLKPMINPLPTGTFTEQWQGDACLQSTASTCGPASVASILKSLGVKSSEREIARAAFSSGSGTEAWYLARYVRSRGLTATFAIVRGFTPSLGFPAMVGVRIGAYGHFIAVTDIDREGVTFVDPLSGKHQISMHEFTKRYEFTGFHMVVEKPPL